MGICLLTKLTIRAGTGKYLFESMRIGRGEKEGEFVLPQEAINSNKEDIFTLTLNPPLKITKFIILQLKRSNYLRVYEVKMFGIKD